MYSGSLGFSVKKSRFGGVTGVEHSSHPQIWEPPRQSPESLFSVELAFYQVVCKTVLAFV